MEPSEAAAVRQHRLELTERMELSGALIYLRSVHPPVISDHRVDAIENKEKNSTPLAAKSLLLDDILKAKSGFEGLLSALAYTNYPDLVTKLRESEAKHRLRLDAEAKAAAVGVAIQPRLQAEAFGEVPPLLLPLPAEELAAAIPNSFAFKDQVGKLTTRLEETKDQHLQLEQTLSKTVNELGDAMNQIATVSEQREQLSEDNKKLNVTLDERGTQLQLVTSECTQAKDDAEAAAVAISSLETNVTQLQNVISGIDLANVPADSAARAQAVASKFDELDEEKNNLRLQLAASESKTKVLEEASDYTQQVLQEYHGAITQALKRALIVGGCDRIDSMERLSLIGGGRKVVKMKMGLQHLSCARLSDGRGLIVGGVDDNDEIWNLCYYVDPETLDTSPAPSLPIPLATHATVTQGSAVFLTHRDGCFVLRDGAWTKFRNMLSGSADHGSASDGSRVAVFGGYGSRVIVAGNRYHQFGSDFVALYSPGADAWAPGPELSTLKDGLRAAFLDGRFYVVGGGGNAFQKVEAWDPRTPHWETLPPTIEGRWSHGLLTMQERLFAFGGHDNDGTVEVYEPRVNRWTMSKARLSKPGYDFGYCAI